MKLRSISPCLAAACLLVVFRAAAEPVVIDVPIGGWRTAPVDDDHYVQEVHYPASQVNVDTHQSTAAMIRGHIATAPKATPTAKSHRHGQEGGGSATGRLIVNGSAMPVRIDETGNFARPYAFGSGANGVEVRTADGQAARVQFYQTTSARAAARIRVLLSWDTDGTDLDLHVVSPSGEHTWYGDRVARNGAALDVDVTTGYGPEIYSNPAPEHGTYLVYVNYYGQGDNRDDLTVADVTVVTDENTPAEKKQFFRAPMRRSGELTLINAFVY